jgi:hypothetical protein
LLAGLFASRLLKITFFPRLAGLFPSRLLKITFFPDLPVYLRRGF